MMIINIIYDNNFRLFDSFFDDNNIIGYKCLHMIDFYILKYMSLLSK